MAQFEKHFTLEEANALLPEVRALLEQVKEHRDHLIVDFHEAQPVLKQAKQNGGGHEAHSYLTDVARLNESMERLIGLGVQLKDIDRGLVDFPAWREGQEVLLCWHLGEDEIRFWHDLESGYPGRQPL